MSVSLIRLTPMTNEDLIHSAFGQSALLAALAERLEMLLRELAESSRVVPTTSK